MIRKKVYIFQLLFTVCILRFAFPAFSQSVFSSEDDLKKQANKLFDDEDFAKAYPLFSQLLSLYPKDAEYNYKFGTCLLFSTGDKGKAVPYIEYAAKRQKQGVDKEVFFYLGKAYHLNYRFADAIRLYTTYKNVASSKQAKKLDVDRQIEMCQNGEQLLKNVTELSVLEKKEVPESDFFRSYNLSSFKSKIVVKPDDLKTSVDKKKNDQSLMYLDPNQNQIYYSSYGDDDKNGRDIYYVTRNANGDLSKPVRLGDNINTPYDEDYPFLHPNGKILYFCSKGHNSMGGYDIFKSEWDDKTNSWGKPVNMDFAINTPDDDILFISDADDKTAYFSSRRESAMGNIMVYKIKLERKPLDVAIIKGTLAKEVGDKIPSAKITVTKISKDEVVGVFNTNSSDGYYSLNLPNGGKFMFTVESPGFKKSSELVVVPTQQEIKPMKQEITLVNENGQDKIIVKNEFDAQIDSADVELAIQYLKAKASLSVTPEEKQVSAKVVDEKSSPKESASASKSENKTETKKDITPVSNADIIDMAYQDAKETQKDANEMRKSSDAAQQLSNKKNESSLQKNKEATELMKSAETITDPNQKIVQLDKAVLLRKEADSLSKEAAFSLMLSNQMDVQAKAQQQQADDELKFAKDFDNAIKSGASEKKMNDLLAQKDVLDKKSDELKTSFPPDYNKQAEVKQTESSKTLAKYLDVQQDVDDLQTEAKRLRNQAADTKNEGVKQNLNQQADEMEKEADAKKKKADTLNTQAQHLKSQSDSLKNNAVLTTSVLKQIKSSPTLVAETNTVAPTDTTITAKVVNETATQPATTTTTTITESAPLVIKSSYVDTFLNQMHGAENNPKELEREQSLAVIYQSWTDSLDNQIASLKKQLATENSESNKIQIKNKISELQSSVDDKRQKAADSRSKVDNLKMQQALAVASEVSPETTAVSTNTVTAVVTDTSSTKESSPENLKGADNINNYYDKKLKGNENETNEYAKKTKEQEIYNDWSSSLYDESQRLKKEGKNGKADAVENQSKEKQTLAMQATDTISAIETEHPELVEAAKKQQKESAKSENQTSSTETKKESATQPINTTTTSVSKETTTIAKNSVVPTNTIVATNPVATQTTSAVKSETVTPTEKTEATSAEAVPATVKHKDAYTHYASLKDESDWAQKSSDRQEKQSEDFQKQSNEQFNESQKLSQKIAATNDPNIQKVLQQQADDLDKRALKNQSQADSLKTLSKNSEAEANVKRTESELYLQSLDKDAYQEIASATGHTTNSSTASTQTQKESAAKTTEASAKKSETTNTNTVTPENTNTTETAKTNPVLEKTSSSKVATAKTNTISTTNPILTETANTNTVSTATSPVKTETAKTNPVTETASLEKKTEIKTSQPKNEISQPNTEIAAVKAKTESSNVSVNNSANLLNKTELLKYYDALFDKLELSGGNYSAAKPIPVDAPMPEGLIFKVQIGAFKNPIPQNLFKGIKPITAERTPQGLKRYTAGLFQKFSTANNAKTQVNNLGYKDAFVVAFFNGKRISMNEALAKAKEAGENITIASDNDNENKATQPINNSITETSTISTATATDVKSVSGLFYTIQIGVFSKPVSSIQLYNISPLNSEKTENGLIRYTTGRFTDEVKASASKNNIAQKGIADAFVVAYYNGKRISLSAAKTMLDSQGKEVVAKDKQEYSFVPSDTTTSESSAVSLTTSSNKGVVFKVQVGAYKEQVPIEDANRLLKISSKGIKTFKDENGMLVYTVGEFLEYETANNLKTELINQGFAGAFVIAFKNGKKMSASEALDLIKK